MIEDHDFDGNHINGIIDQTDKGIVDNIDDQKMVFLNKWFCQYYKLSVPTYIATQTPTEQPKKV